MCGYTFRFLPTHQQIIILHLNNLILNIYLIVNDFVTISMKNIVKHYSYSLVLSNLILYIYIRKKILAIKGKNNILICVKILTCSNWLLLQCNRWTIYKYMYECTCCIWTVINSLHNITNYQAKYKMYVKLKLKLPFNTPYGVMFNNSY